MNIHEDISTTANNIPMIFICPESSNTFSRDTHKGIADESQ